MSEHTAQDDIEGVSPSPLRRYTLFIMIGCSIVVALLLVSISLSLYSNNGTAQLDLSRPGYQSVRDKVGKEDTFDRFPSSGAVDDSVLGDFKKEYAKHANDATTIDAFSTDVLSDKSLGIDDTPPAPDTQ